MWSKHLKEAAMKLSKVNGANAQTTLIHKQSALSTDQRTALKQAYASPSASHAAAQSYWS